MSADAWSISVVSRSSSPKGLFVGLATIDVSYTVDEVPRRNQKISVPTQRITPGGPANNAAATFAFLGGCTTLVTAIGSHPMATVIRDDLKRLSVRLHDMASGRRDSPPVSSIMVHRATGERSVVSANAAVFSPVRADFDPRWLNGVSIVEVDGQYMPLGIAAAEAACERGIPVVLDSGSWKPGLSKLLPFLDTVICSAEFRPPRCRSEREVFEFLLARGIRRVAVTRGATSVRFVENGKRGEVRVPKMRPVDTLGAGDIFHGAYCYYASQPGTAFAQALAAAARIASFSCRYPGTRLWMSRLPVAGGSTSSGG
jgi:sugar/nucleoside kinase (ribokinase family)